MKDLDSLLADQFVVFSQRIAAIHTEKKNRKEEFKKLYDAFTAELKSLDAQALAAKAEYENWVAGKEPPTPMDGHNA